MRKPLDSYYAKREANIARYQNEDSLAYAGARDEEGFSFSTASLIVFQECAAAQSLVTRNALFGLISEISACGRN